ncbi:MULTISPECIES: hypothetical protein [unclassified Halorubrum]|uniref:hypothetical protein n=1 Tax=unclassified Halorubrum TaxID=2642239 RepID=UPI0003DBAF21|nr:MULTISPECIES: hypothetical protein [unclassified Halorubrum]CDK40783.1 uncharacterized protein BN903_33 [Halorubrum sp. AJ67]
MAENSVPKVVVEEDVEVSVYALGCVGAIAAAYYTGQTGAWEPLMAVSIGLSLATLFVTSES